MSTSCPEEGGHTTLVNNVMLSNKLSSFKRPFFNAAFKKDNDNTSSYRCCESNGGHCSGRGGGWVPEVEPDAGCGTTIVKNNHNCQTSQLSNITSVKTPQRQQVHVPDVARRVIVWQASHALHASMWWRKRDAVVDKQVLVAVAPFISSTDVSPNSATMWPHLSSCRCSMRFLLVL